MAAAKKDSAPAELTDEQRLVAALKRGDMQSSDLGSYTPAQKKRALAAKPQQRGANLRAFILNGDAAKAAPAEKGEAKPKAANGGGRASKYSDEDRALCIAAMERANKRAAKPMKTQIRPRELVLVKKGLGRRKPSDISPLDLLDKVARAREETPEPLAAFVAKVDDPIVRPRIAAAVLAEMEASK